MAGSILCSLQWQATFFVHALFDFLQGPLHCLLFVCVLLFFSCTHIISLVPGECKLRENLHLTIVYRGSLGQCGEEKGDDNGT